MQLELSRGQKLWLFAFAILVLVSWVPERSHSLVGAVPIGWIAVLASGPLLWHRYTDELRTLRVFAREVAVAGEAVHVLKAVASDRERWLAAFLDWACARADLVGRHIPPESDLYYGGQWSREELAAEMERLLGYSFHFNVDWLNSSGGANE